MKTATLLAAYGAAVVAAAGPLGRPYRKICYKTEVVVRWKTVTVTEGVPSTTVEAVSSSTPEPTSESTSFSIVSTDPEETSQPPESSPEPEPTSSTPQPEPTSSTPQPEPTSSTPQPEPTSSTPQPEPTSSTPQPEPTSSTPQPEPTSSTPEPEPTSSTPEPEPTSSTPPPEPVQPVDDYIRTALEHHNVHRANHSAPDLTWSDALANSAAVLAKRCVFDHDVSINGGGYGQNLAMWASSSLENMLNVGELGSVARAISNGWYNNEAYLYANEYGKPTPNWDRFADFGHFTQLIWKNTQEVGCFTYLCPAGTMLDTMSSWYTVCNYSPSGNFLGDFDKNVLPPLGHPAFYAAE
ncbi:hypothetical protein VTJ83DRAFT_1488 [Remersonia thermophila]|uniref:SCP domain-containing protein n=1 Tax=Remersonia thermophila TaxID=72144 RepID=A0ABR4DG72_9PEZI